MKTKLKNLLTGYKTKPFTVRTTSWTT